MKKIIIIFIMLVMIVFAVPSFFSVLGNKYIPHYTTNLKENQEILSKSEKKISVYIENQDKVVTMDLEEYLIGVLIGEMPASFESEALKAQAIVARTYVINRVDNPNIQPIENHKGAKICTNFAHCQAYISPYEAVSKWGVAWKNAYYQKIKDAVDSTKGEIVLYNNEPITAVFHSSNNGYTESSNDVWGGNLPYLKSVKSEGEELSPKYESSETFSIAEFQKRLKSLNNNIKFKGQPNKFIEKIEYTAGNYVKTIDISGVTFKGVDIRYAFNLKSAGFTIKIDKDVVFNVKGYGHGVGMSQYGANYLAKEGYTYDAILKKYYTGVEIKKIIV